MMKKKICIALVISLIWSSSPVFAQHWAESAITYMVEKGWLNGDETGNMNPDGEITRAELAALLNRIFEVPEAEGENFPDVSKDAWYSQDMLKVKHAGYLRGDEMGNGNPETPVTRAEAATILARAMKRDGVGTTERFVDGDTIPDWALSAVAVLTEEQLFSGYPDGSFRPDERMTRGEIFSVLYRFANQKVTDEPVVAPTVTPTATPVPTQKPSVSISTVGGGGAGGGTSSTVKLKAPVIQQVDAQTDTLYWNDVKNATSYEVELSVNNKTEVLSTEDTILVLKEKIDEITLDNQDASYEISVRIKALTDKKGYKDSSYSDSASYEKIYPCVETPVLTVANKTVGGKNRAVISVAEVENAASYEGKLLIGGQESDGMVYEEANRLFIIPDTAAFAGQEATVCVKAISGEKPAYRDSVAASIAVSDVPVGGNGTKESPYLIYNKADFDKIRANPSAHYALAADVDLGAYEPITEFTGSLCSLGERRVLSYQVDLKEDTVGLFRTLKGTVSNVVLAGSVSGGNKVVGGLCGVADGALIENCVSLVTATGGDYVGGFVGNIWSGEIRGCYFNGTVHASSYGGGIVGYQSNSLMQNCANLGTIYVAYSFGGGIAGSFAGRINYCYNAGDIISTATNKNAYYTMGGIAGAERAAYPAYGCFNTGTVNGGKNSAAGIIGGYQNGNSSIVASGCYNVGTLIGETSTEGIAYRNDTSVSNPVTISDSFYPNTMTGTYGTAVSADVFQNPEAPEVVTLINDYGYMMIDAYPYLVQPGIDYVETLDIKAVSLNLKAVCNQGNLQITWDAQNDSAIASMEISVINNNNFLPVVTEEALALDTTGYLLENVAEDIYYEIVISISYVDGATVMRSLEIYVPAAEEGNE